MTIDDNTKVDLLWKKNKGKAPTSSTKSPANEAFSSLTPIFQKNFWTDSDRIPAIAPTTVVPNGNELWFGVIEPHKQNQAIRLYPDPTTSHTAWHAIAEYNDGLIPGNSYKNFVPDTFAMSYSITVWAGNPMDSNSFDGPAQRLAPDNRGNEWEFDYNSGILFFPNNVPEVAIQRGIWIEGWRYIGEIGRENSSSGASNTSRIRTFTFTTSPLGSGLYSDFVFQTGGKCILVEAKLSGPGTLECHATSSRTDTNPYRFKAIDSHLVDDGSYIIAGQRFYGERFVPLINMEDTMSDVTYWRVYNNNNSSLSVLTVIVSVA